MQPALAAVTWWLACNVAALLHTHAHIIHTAARHATYISSKNNLHSNHWDSDTHLEPFKHITHISSHAGCHRKHEAIQFLNKWLREEEKKQLQSQRRNLKVYNIFYSPLATKCEWPLKVSASDPRNALRDEGPAPYYRGQVWPIGVLCQWHRPMRGRHQVTQEVHQKSGVRSAYLAWWPFSFTEEE